MRLISAQLLELFLEKLERPQPMMLVREPRVQIMHVRLLRKSYWLVPAVSLSRHNSFPILLCALVRLCTYAFLGRDLPPSEWGKGRLANIALSLKSDVPTMLRVGSALMGSGSDAPAVRPSRRRPRPHGRWQDQIQHISQDVSVSQY
jgi:hypothetical protein